MSALMGYRLEFKPGDPCYYTPKDYATEQAAGYDGADTWGLFQVPQPGCQAEVEVYFGWCWVRPKYASGKDLTDFTPLYRGPKLKDAPMDEAVLLLFPSLVEDRLKQERPDLYRPGN